MGAGGADASVASGACGDGCCGRDRFATRFDGIELRLVSPRAKGRGGGRAMASRTGCWGDRCPSCGAAATCHAAAVSSVEAEERGNRMLLKDFLPKDESSSSLLPARGRKWGAELLRPSARNIESAASKPPSSRLVRRVLLAVAGCRCGSTRCARDASRSTASSWDWRRDVLDLAR